MTPSRARRASCSETRRENRGRPASRGAKELARTRRAAPSRRAYPARDLELMLSVRWRPGGCCASLAMSSRRPEPEVGGFTSPLATEHLAGGHVAVHHPSGLCRRPATRAPSEPARPPACPTKTRRVERRPGAARGKRSRELSGLAPSTNRCGAVCARTPNSSVPATFGWSRQRGLPCLLSMSA